MPKSQRLTVRTTVITPAYARELLDTQEHNRNLSKRRVQQMADDITSVRWVANGESIKIDRNGKLIDGQHRLSGCILAGKPFTSLVVTGLDPKVIESIDQGASRSPGNVLQMLKPPAKNANNTASALRMLWQFEKFGQPIMAGGRTYGNAHPTRAMIIAKYYELRGLEESIQLGMRLKKHLGFLSPANIAVCHWLFKSKSGLTKADAFFEELEAGGGGRGSATFTLLTRLRGNRPTRRESGVAFTIKAWNAWVEGKKLAVIKYSASESFPDILGGKS